MHYIYSEDGDFIRDLKEIIAANHFTINEKKTRLQKKGERQEVTGLVLSDKVNVVRTYTREIRTLLHIWEKFGSLAVNESFMRYLRGNPVHRHKGGMPNLETVLMGKLLYLKMVKGDNDPTYLALMDRFVKLSGKGKKSISYSYDGSNNLNYSQSMSLEKFEEALSVKVVYNPDSEPKLFFMADDEKRAITISQTITSDILSKLFDGSDISTALWNKYQISLCDNGTTSYYLLHKKLVAPQHTKAGKRKTDELQEELSALVESDIFSQVLNEDKVDGKNYKVVSMEDIASDRVEVANRERLIALMEADIPEPDNL